MHPGRSVEALHLFHFTASVDDTYVYLRRYLLLTLVGWLVVKLLSISFGSNQIRPLSR